MTKHLLKLTTAAIALLSCATATAGGGTGKVVMLMAHSNDVAIFALDGAHGDKPACSSDQWALSLATQGGRAMYALLMGAQAQGKPVVVFGTGACGAWGDREAPSYIYMQ